MLNAAKGYNGHMEMHLPLKLANDILRPWERLNTGLVKKSSIDSNISDFMSVAEDLCVKLSHFPELTGRKSIRTDKTSNAFAAIVDVADTLKHRTQKKGRANNLSVSSLFEGDDVGRFRFIRNRIIIDHEMYGKSDFLESLKEAVQFLIGKIGLNLYWNPTILEAPEIFDEKVSLDIYFTHQITWRGLTIEFVKRTPEGEFKHFDPPSWPIELRSAQAGGAPSYFNYITQLLQRSIGPPSTLGIKVPMRVLESSGSETFVADFVITTVDPSKKSTTVVQVVSDASGSLAEFQAWEDLVAKSGIDNVILVSQHTFAKEVQEHVALSLRNVYLITVDKFDAYSIPLRFFHINYKQSTVRMTNLYKSDLGVSKQDATLFGEFKQLPIKSLGRVFSRDRIDLMPFTDLCLSLLRHKSSDARGRKALKYGPKGDTEIYFKSNDTFIRIGIDVDFEWEEETKDLRMPILHYDRSELGISIWNLQTFYSCPRGTVGLSIPVAKYGDTSAVGILSTDPKGQAPKA
jgi:hypothetical protein